MKYPKLSDIWNSLHATQQQFWSQRALKLNKTPLLGQFTNIPQSLIHNNMLSHQKIISAITMDWQRFVKMFRYSVRRNPTKKTIHISIQISQSSSVYWKAIL